MRVSPDWTVSQEIPYKVVAREMVNGDVRVFCCGASNARPSRKLALQATENGNTALAGVPTSPFTGRDCFPTNLGL